MSHSRSIADLGLRLMHERESWQGLCQLEGGAWQELRHREAGGGFEPYVLLERRSSWESAVAEMAAEPGIHVSLSDSETLKDAKSLIGVLRLPVIGKIKY